MFCESKEELDMALAVCNEMSDIINNKNNSSGFHLNHIVSGKPIYCVYDNTGFVYTLFDEYATEEEAKEEAAKHPNAKIDVWKDADKPYRVDIVDDKMTARMREEKWGGDFVDEFDSRDEAEEEAKQYEFSYIEEEDSAEWWSVIHNASGKLAYRILFPTEARALAFLYSVAKPKAWMAYVDRGREVGK